MLLLVEISMPTYCYTDFTVSHWDTDLVDRFENAFKRGRLFEEFLPVPDECKVIDPNVDCGIFTPWRKWRVQNWGTKWDVGSLNGDGSITRDNPHMLRGWYRAAYSPAYEGFLALGELGYQFALRFMTEDETCYGYADNGSYFTEDPYPQDEHCADDDYVSATDMARNNEVPCEDMMDQMFFEDDLDVVSRGAFV